MNKQLNFKIVGVFLLVLISTLSFKTTLAGHVFGADISVRCITANTYEITLGTYKDCGGPPLPGIQPIRMFAACTGLDVLVNIQRLSITDVSQPCPAQQSSCSGGTGTFGVERHVFIGILTVPAGTNCPVRFSWKTFIRSGAITTLTLPFSSDTYIETTVDNSLATCNSSPKFTLDPILFYPVNQPASFNYIVTDDDGDSLFYSLVPALSDAGIPVTYIAGHSGAQPLGSGVPFVIDQNTGTVTFTPNLITHGVLALKVEEFRNGVSIGAITRDVDVFITASANVSPTISGFHGGLNNDTVICPNQLFTSQIFLTGSSNVFIDATISNNIPGLSVSQQVVNTDTTILTINWMPTAANTGNNLFYVTAVSDQCPTRLISSKGFNIVVGPNPPFISASVLSNATCATSTDGSTYYNTSPALLPGYSVEWFDNTNTLVGTSDTLQNVGTGIYTVKISLGAGLCTISDNVLLGHNNSTTSTAAFSMSAPTGCSAPHTVNFTDQSTVNDIACGTVWAWTFGDGGTSILQNPSYVYMAAGIYPVSLTVTDCSVSCPTTVWDTVKISTPTVDFTGSNITGCAPLTSVFSDGSVSPAGIVSWNWNFGDGNTATTQNPSNVYLTPGNYTVSLSVTDANGCTAGPEVKTNFVAASLALASTDTHVECDSHTWIDGITYTTSNNTASVTLTASNGCDSVVTLDLTINNSSASTDTQIACDSFTWSDGITYTTSNNTAAQTFTNAAGCDSILTLNLTINNSSANTDPHVACDTLTWIDGITYTVSNNTATQTFTNAVGCDSVVTLDLTINNSNTSTDTYVECDSFTWIDGVTYTANNTTATFTLMNAAGCDSVVTLDLTINNSNTGIDTQATCLSFTWIDGNTYTTSNNTATFALTNAVGCDSIVTLDLIISLDVNTTDTQVACDSYLWIDGNTYTSNNSTATQTLIAAAGCDSIVTLNLTINNSTATTDTQLACDAFTWTDGITYTVSNNTATQTFMNAVGCDSVITLNLTINNSNASTDTQVACDTLLWIDGITYTTSNNTATQTLTNAAGCDSVVTLDLTINNSSATTDTQVACDTLLWIDGITYTTSNNTATFTLSNAVGCDSVVTLDLTINNSSSSTDTQVACDTLLWIDGNVYSANNNTAMFTLPNSAGCDSVVTLDLTIGGVDTTLSQSGDTLLSNQAGATYQWIDCGNGDTILPGDTTQMYIATTSGDYAVIVTSGNCSDTSDCINVIITGIESVDRGKEFTVYPNPTTGNSFVRFTKQQEVYLVITDLTGKVLFETVEYDTDKIELPVAEFVKGIYLVKIQSEQKQDVIKLVKQ